jgi:hypothetical protein
MYVPWWGFVIALFVIGGIAGINGNARRIRHLQLHDQLEELKSRLEELSSNGASVGSEIEMIEDILLSLSQEND